MKIILKPVFVRTAPLVFLLYALCASVVNSRGQDFKTVKPGVEYSKVRRDFSGQTVNIDLLRLDLKKVRIDLHHAGKSVIGTDLTSSIAVQNSGIAAINAGFFRLDKSPFLGDPVGMFMVDGNWLSEPTNNRIQLLINNKSSKTEIEFARTKPTESIRVGGEIFDVTGLNRERKKDDLIIYTPEFGRTTQTGSGGLEMVVVKGVIMAMADDLGNAVIPPNGLVISASGTFREGLSKVAKDSGTVSMIRKWEGLPAVFEKDRANLDVVAGVPLLIQNGRIDITWQLEKSSQSFVETRHPRTAVAKLKDGRFLMLVADGRTEDSGGIGLEDLAAFLLELGATDAMNLDGGGSTTMYVDGKVVNHPSDKEGERKVSDALVVTMRRKR